MVPSTTPGSVAMFALGIRARPKSRTFACPSGVTRMLLGLMSRWTTFRRVTLPMIGPSVLAGSVLCWARALGEFGATITFAGNLQGRTQTLPLAVFEQLQTDTDAAFAVSMLLILLAFAVILALRGRFLR